jgi:hypothetical protein
MASRFTLSHLTNPRQLPDSTACVWEVDVDGIRPGHVIAEPATIATTVGVRRVPAWVVHAMNLLIDDHGEDAVITALISADGLRVANPRTARDLPG